MKKFASIVFGFSVALAACTHSSPSKLPTASASKSIDSAAAAAIVASPDRSDEDRALDAGRKPADTLVFAGIAPGMHVAELGAGGGYTSELLARAVGPTGKVYGQNSKELLAFFAEKPWTARLAKPINANVTRFDAPFDAPFPADFADQGKLDAVVDILFYHDTVWLKVDREKMNSAIFSALKSGGVYVVVDHAAKPSDGIAVTETLHRIAEQSVIDEVKRAGFVVDGNGDFLRNANDTHEWNASPVDAGAKRGTSDRFALRFRKP
jgi:predicted methyltransferase